MYRPAPFYAMDEIDMFLDGANVERVAKLIKRISGQAQFIVVSLRKPMILQSKYTLGVTMQENNLSSSYRHLHQLEADLTKEASTADSGEKWRISSSVSLRRYWWNWPEEGRYDPWDIDIARATEKFLEYIDSLEKRDLRIPARTLLYASILLRMKSDSMEGQKEEEPEPEAEELESAEEEE